MFSVSTTVMEPSSEVATEAQHIVFNVVEVQNTKT